MENKCCVYAHINKINNKAYIGITGQEPKKRWGINGARYSLKKHRKFHEAIKKYGWNNFEHIILLENLTCSQAKEYEIKLIKEFDSYNNGYNMTMGGDGKVGTPSWIKGKKQSEETKKKISESEKGKIVSDSTRQKISESHKGQIAWNKGKIWSDEYCAKHSNSKRVFQYSLDGKLINEFYSCSKASKETGINAMHISRVARGERKTAGGYVWKYEKG